MKPTQFFAKRETSGNNNCYYCGADCGNEYRSKGYVKPTFTNRDIVSDRNSEYVCENCVLCFSEKCNSINLARQETREAQSIRTYSWIITADEKIAYTKAHFHLLKEVVLNPPDPPFMIVLSDSGQKHLIFRSKVAYEKDNFPVSLEDEIIYVKRELLKCYFEVLEPIIAACGKPLLKNTDQNLQKITMIVYKTFEEAETFIENLLQCKDKSLLKLATWLSKNKEACNELLESRGIQRKDFKLEGSGKSRHAARRISEDGGCQAMLDFS